VAVNRVCHLFGKYVGRNVGPRVWSARAEVVAGKCILSEIAAAEEIDRGYIGSILRLALLAPDIIEAILEVAVMTFGPVQVISDFQTADLFQPPSLSEPAVSRTDVHPNASPPRSDRDGGRHHLPLRDGPVSRGARARTRRPW
jgi:hypothetical protein